MTTFVITALFVTAVVHFVADKVLHLVLLVAALAAVRHRLLRVLRLRAPTARTSPLTLPVSAIVPAYNEVDVVDAVQALLNSTLPELEVIVVDDGSTDDTAARLRQAFDFAPAPIEVELEIPSAPILGLERSRQHPHLWLVRKENDGGKGDAVNAGLNFTRYRYVLVTDADCVFDPDALLTVMTAIGTDAARNVAAGGQVRVRNGMRVEAGRITDWRLPRSLLCRFQIVEYLGALVGNRPGWNAINGVPVLSGAFGVWRRDLLLELGGFATDTTHEDIEMTLRVHEHFRRLDRDYRILVVPDAVVWTEVPHRWSDLYRQRKRWQRVVLECVWRYRHVTFNPRYGEVGTVTMPYLLFFEAIGPVIEAGAILSALLLLILGELSLFHLGLFLVFSASLVTLTRIVSMTADAWLYRRFQTSALLKLPMIAFLELLIYRPVILLARLLAVPEFLQGRTTWERAARERDKGEAGTHA